MIPSLETESISWRCSTTITCVGFSPYHFACGCKDGTVHLYAIESGSETGRWSHAGGIVSLEFSKDGKQLAIATTAKRVALYDTNHGALLHSWDQEDNIYALAFSYPWLAIGGGQEDLDGYVTLMNAASGQTTHRWTHQDAVYSVAIAPNQRSVLSGCLDTYAYLFDRDSGRMEKLWGHGGGVWSVGFSPQGERIVIGESWGTARLIDLVSSRELRRWIKEEPVWSVAFSTKGEQILVGCFDNTVSLLEVSSGREIHLWSHDSQVVNTLLSPNDQLVATGLSDRVIDLYATDSGALLKRRSSPTDIQAIAFSVDSDFLLLGGEDGGAYLLPCRRMG